MMLARFEGFDLIVKLMVLRLTYASHSFLSPEWFIRCFQSELLNDGTTRAPTGQRS